MKMERKNRTLPLSRNDARSMSARAAPAGLIARLGARTDVGGKLTYRLYKVCSGRHAPVGRSRAMAWCKARRGIVQLARDGQHRPTHAPLFASGES
jgi:hypothetical protein